MIIVYDSLHAIHNPRFEIYDGVKTEYPETSDRVETIAKSLARTPGHTFLPPRLYKDDQLFALHRRQYVGYVRTRSNMVKQGDDMYPSNFIHDTYAPLVSGTYAAARQSLSIAMTGADCLLQGAHAAYALCRPPGHHAGDGYMGGYCYFNNAAIAANRLSENARISILDIDFHHGNGTQQLFYERKDVQYVSVHANPEDNYPYSHGYENEIGEGAGRGFNHNFLVEKDCGYKSYLRSFLMALDTVRQFRPDYLVLSLGFDGYKDDPIAGFGLTAENYTAFARLVAGMHIPTLLVQEGGYCVEALGELAQTFTTEFDLNAASLCEPN